MKLVLNTKTLCAIKDKNPHLTIPTFQGYTVREIQQILIIMAYTDYLKSLGLVKDLEVELDVR